MLIWVFFFPFFVYMAATLLDKKPALLTINNTLVCFNNFLQKIHCQIEYLSFFRFNYKESYFTSRKKIFFILLSSVLNIRVIIFTLDEEDWVMFLSSWHIIITVCKIFLLLISCYFRILLHSLQQAIIFFYLKV